MRIFFLSIIEKIKSDWDFFIRFWYAYLLFAVIFAVAVLLISKLTK
jgi:hypothetical protein